MSAFSIWPIEYISVHEDEVNLNLAEKDHLDAWRSWKESQTPPPRPLADRELWRAISHQGREIATLKKQRQRSDAW